MPRTYYLTLMTMQYGYVDAQSGDLGPDGAEESVDGIWGILLYY